MPSGNLGYDPLFGGNNLDEASLKLQNSPAALNSMIEALNARITVNESELQKLDSLKLVNKDLLSVIELQSNTIKSQSFNNNVLIITNVLTILLLFFLLIKRNSK